MYRPLPDVGSIIRFARVLRFDGRDIERPDHFVFAVLNLAKTVKYGQWQDSVKATQAVQSTLATATQRYAYYQKMLGRTDAQINSSLPQLAGLAGKCVLANEVEGVVEAAVVFARDGIDGMQVQQITLGMREVGDQIASVYGIGAVGSEGVGEDVRALPDQCARPLRPSASG